MLCMHMLFRIERARASVASSACMFFSRVFKHYASGRRRTEGADVAAVQEEIWRKEARQRQRSQQQRRRQCNGGNGSSSLSIASHSPATSDSLPGAKVKMANSVSEVASHCSWRRTLKHSVTRSQPSLPARDTALAFRYLVYFICLLIYAVSAILPAVFCSCLIICNMRMEKALCKHGHLFCCRSR